MFTLKKKEIIPASERPEVVGLHQDLQAAEIQLAQIEAERLRIEKILNPRPVPTHLNTQDASPADVTWAHARKEPALQEACEISGRVRLLREKLTIARRQASEAVLDERRSARCELVTAYCDALAAASKIADEIYGYDRETSDLGGKPLYSHPWPFLLGSVAEEIRKNSKEWLA